MLGDYQNWKIYIHFKVAWMIEAVGEELRIITEN